MNNFRFLTSYEGQFEHCQLSVQINESDVIVQAYSVVIKSAVRYPILVWYICANTSVTSQMGKHPRVILSAVYLNTWIARIQRGTGGPDPPPPPWDLSEMWSCVDVSIQFNSNSLFWEGSPISYAFLPRGIQKYLDRADRDSFSLCLVL